MEKPQNVETNSVGNDPKSSKASLIYYGIAFALLGLSAGVFAGLSNSPVIGVLLPLLFGLIGGANGIYLYQVDLNKLQDRRRLTLIGQMLSVFLIFMLAGSVYGILVRTGNGLSEFTPRLRSVEEVPAQPVTISDLESLDAGTALELTLLRYRLQALGADDNEQRAILATAKEAIDPHVDRAQLASNFEHLLALASQIDVLLSEQTLGDASYSYEVERIQDFIAISSYQYRYLVDELPQHNVPVEHLVNLIDEDRSTYSNFIRESRWTGEYELAPWLLDHPEIRQKLWDLELAYLDTAYKMRDLGWLSGQPLAETIDQLIRTSGTQGSPDAGSDIVSEARDQGPAFAP